MKTHSIIVMIAGAAMVFGCQVHAMAQDGARLPKTKTISVQIVETSLGYTLFVKDAPAFVRVLAPAPTAPEPFLSQGTWIVLIVPVWRPNGFKDINEAVKCLESANGRAQLGIRVFQRFDELKTWLPMYNPSARDYRVPIWVVVQDGQIRGWTVGNYTAPEITTFLNSSVKADEK